jgi:hypothetical protein
MVTGVLGGLTSPVNEPPRGAGTVPLSQAPRITGIVSAIAIGARSRVILPVPLPQTRLDRARFIASGASIRMAI